MKTAHIKAAFAALPEERIGERTDGRTRAMHIEQSAPLKIARTFSLDGGALGVCIMDASPGMLAGDCYRLEFDLADGAHVEVGTQGFTRVHPQREASRENPCALHTRLRVGDGARLEWFPEPLMLYADADLRAQTTVELAPRATFLASDIWCAGRIGRGENWQFARYRNRWNIARAGAPIFASALDLAPRNFDPQQVGAWKDYTHSGNFWAFVPAPSEDLTEALWTIVEGQNTVYAGVSALENGGIVVSMLGRRAHDLQELTKQLRGEVKQGRGDLR